MGRRVVEQNGDASGDGGISIPPNEVISQLLGRINNLTMELAVKDALIARLQQEHVPEQEALDLGV